MKKMQRIPFSARLALIAITSSFTWLAGHSKGSNTSTMEATVSISQQVVGNREIDVLVINGTAEPDIAVVKVGGNGDIKVTVNGQLTRWSPTEFQRIRFLGRSGNDEFTNNTDIDSAIFGHKGNDVLRGGNGHNWIQGGDGDDEIYGGDKNDHLRGRKGNDFIDAGKRHDRVFGGDGDDVIVGAAGNDFIKGEAGDDVIFGGNGDDRIDGGPGNDEIMFGNSLGRDIALYEGNLSEYIVDFSDPTLMVATPGELDIIEQVDFVRFDDDERPVDDFALELTEVEGEILRLLNALRSSQGLHPLTIKFDLTEFARFWVETELAPLGVPTRQELDNAHSTFADFGYLLIGERNGHGENLAWWPNQNFSPTQMADRVHNLWVNSPGHYANMTSSQFDEVGIGVTRTSNGWYFSQFFMSNR